MNIKQIKITILVIATSVLIVMGFNIKYKNTIESLPQEIHQKPIIDNQYTIIDNQKPIIDYQFDNIDENKPEITCLAKNIYFEAAPNKKDQLAVAMVTMNRVKSSKFPNTICKVINEKHNNICQFSWVCDGKSDTPKEEEKYKQSLAVASLVWYAKVSDPTNGAMFFHNTSIKGEWFKKKLTKTVQIGSHIYYK